MSLAEITSRGRSKITAKKALFDADFDRGNQLLTKDPWRVDIDISDPKIYRRIYERVRRAFQKPRSR